MDMDPHSVDPPYFMADVGAGLASQADLVNALAQSCAAELVQAPVSVQGRLKKCLKFWEERLQASEFVLGIICSGYRLPFIRLPPPVCMQNHRFTLNNAAFVSDSIQELLLANCVVECDECPLVCSPVQVATNAKGKQRLVIHLRYVNQHLVQYKFKHEGLNVIPLPFQKGDFMITFDLKSGYHHVDISRDCWPYLGYWWYGSGGRRQFFMFQVLPFSLSTACYVFTKCSGRS